MYNALSLGRRESCFEDLPKAIKENEISSLQQEMIDEVRNACGVSGNIARALLLRLHWNPEQIINQFLEKPLV